MSDKWVESAQKRIAAQEAFFASLREWILTVNRQSPDLEPESRDLIQKLDALVACE